MTLVLSNSRLNLAKFEALVVEQSLRTNPLHRGILILRPFTMALALSKVRLAYIRGPNCCIELATHLEVAVKPAIHLEVTVKSAIHLEVSVKPAIHLEVCVTT